MSTYNYLSTNKLNIIFSTFLFVFISQFSVIAQTPLFAETPVSDSGTNNNIGSANTSRNITDMTTSYDLATN